MKYNNSETVVVVPPYIILVSKVLYLVWAKQLSYCPVAEIGGQS